MWKSRLDSLTRLLGEEGNPLHSPDVSSTRLRGGPDTTLQVTSKGRFRFRLRFRLRVRFRFRIQTILAQISKKTKILHKILPFHCHYGGSGSKSGSGIGSEFGIVMHSGSAKAKSYASGSGSGSGSSSTTLIGSLRN